MAKMKKEKTNSKMKPPRSITYREPADTMVHATGRAAVQFRDHFVEAAHHEGITRPAKVHAGSHDHLVRGDGAELKGHSEKASEQAWTPKSKKAGRGEY